MKYLITILFAILCGDAFSQEKQLIQIHCDKTETVISTIRKEYGQEMLLWGKGPEGSTGLMSLWINASTNTWTMLVSHQDEKTCIIGGGRDFTVRPPEKPKSNGIRPLL